jgi:cardiolipin synthase
MIRAVAWLMSVALVVGGCAHLRHPETLPSLAVDEAAFARTLEAHADAPVEPGNTIDVLLNGDEIFPAELAAIHAARRTITYEQYFWHEGRVATAFVDAFAERCRAGVAVHILLDGFGAVGISRDSMTRLRSAGCAVAFFRPLRIPFPARMNNRNHRRALVVDGTVGFTGGAGLSDKWEGDGRSPEHWRDTGVRVAGPVVRYLQGAFVDKWLEATGVLLGGDPYFPRLDRVGDVAAQVIASAPAKGDFAIYSAFLLAIAGARRAIFITNPYFVPDEPMTDALLAAVRRGVHVVVLLPGKIDFNVVRRVSRHALGPLLRGGVEVYEYNAGLLHAKTMVVDGLWSTVGTTNLDPRSLSLNAEVNVVMYDAAVATRLEHDFAADVRYSRRLDYGRWRTRPLWQRLLELVSLSIAPEL